VVALAKVPHGVIEPIELMLGLGTDDTATHYVLKQLIAGLLERRWLRNLPATTRLLFGHEFLEKSMLESNVNKRRIEVRCDRANVRVA